MLRNIWIVARRELGAFFAQPIAYIVIIMVLLVTGYIFAGQLALASQPGADVRPTVVAILSSFAFLMLFASPAITMRLLSEEQKSGTMELLMTLPVRDGEVVLGKFLAAFLLYLILLLLTAVYPLVLLRFGNPDPGPLIGAYLGVILWGAALLAIGTMTSASTENQIVAFFLSFGISLILLLSGLAATLFASNPSLNTIFMELSFNDHLNAFLAGLVNAKDVLYYALIAAVSLFAAARMLESRRWR
ncbi:MAG: ABC transporter permease [Candidatus Promineifilaceae bacterium]